MSEGILRSAPAGRNRLSGLELRRALYMKSWYLTKSQYTHVQLPVYKEVETSEVLEGRKLKQKFALVHTNVENHPSENSFSHQESPMEVSQVVRQTKSNITKLCPHSTFSQYEINSNSRWLRKPLSCCGGLLHNEDLLRRTKWMNNWKTWRARPEQLHHAPHHPSHWGEVGWHRPSGHQLQCLGMSMRIYLWEPAQLLVNTSETSK